MIHENKVGTRKAREQKGNEMQKGECIVGVAKKKHGRLPTREMGMGEHPKPNLKDKSKQKNNSQSGLHNLD